VFCNVQDVDLDTNCCTRQIPFDTLDCDPNLKYLSTASLTSI
jgi:hypothetical protein